MVATTKTLAQIPPSPVPPISTDQFVGVTGGPNDVLFSLAQLQGTIPGGATGPQGPPGPQGPSGIVSGVPDPLTLTLGLQLTTDNPTFGGDATFRRSAYINTTYDQLNSSIGFTDQQGLAVNLNFNAGYNQYGDPQNINGKYTPIGLAVNGTYYGAGEKFVQTWGANMYSMGDSFLWSAEGFTYAGGPVPGDEGQGWTPVFLCTQPNALFVETITAVHRTTYSTTVTAPVSGSYIAQAIPVASTAGATVGDWVILNQQLMKASTRIWAMQIQSIQPGVSITGVCAINLLIGDTVKPALCLNTSGGGFGFGEGRVVVNNSGASYSTGVVGSVSGGAFLGSGTAWTTTMVGGDALNIGAIYLTVDNLTSAPFSGASPLRSVYQIATVSGGASLAVFSLSVANDQAYHGRGEPPASNMAYKVVPSARVMKWNPPGGGFNVICEYSAHTWTVGDTIECVICPYPDLHGFDFQIGEWTAGGTRRSAISMLNNGARTMETGLFLSARGGIGANPDFDTFAWATGVQISSAKVGISVTNTSSLTSYAMTANSSANDTGAAIQLQSSGGVITITPVTATAGADIQLIGTGGGGLLRAVSSTFNIDTNQPQLVWNGYLQIVSGGGGFAPYLRIGGNNTPGSNTDTADISYVSAARALSFRFNDPGNTPTSVTGLTVSRGLLGLGAQGGATSNITNVPSVPIQLGTSTWSAGAAHNYWAQLQAVPGSGVDDAPVSLQTQIWDNVNNNATFPNVPFEVRTDGLLKFGSCNFGFSTDKRLTLDASAKLTAARTATWPDTSGDVLVAATNTTGAGSAALGANSPAVTNAAPYTWLRMLSHDGSTVYVPAWK